MPNIPPFERYKLTSDFFNLVNMSLRRLGVDGGLRQPYLLVGGVVSFSLSESLLRGRRSPEPGGGTAGGIEQGNEREDGSGVE